MGGRHTDGIARRDPRARQTENSRRADAPPSPWRLTGAAYIRTTDCPTFRYGHRSIGSLQCHHAMDIL